MTLATDIAGSYNGAGTVGIGVPGPSPDHNRFTGAIMATPTIGNQREEWRPVGNGCGGYSVSSCGMVRNESTGRILALGLSDKGYPKASLYTTTGKHATLRVHRLVAMAFIGPVPNGCEVNHINGIKTDNRAENLEYTTRSGNMKHGFSTGIIKRRAGEAHNRAVLTHEQAVAIRNSSSPRSELATAYGVSKWTITAIRSGRTWKHL